MRLVNRSTRKLQLTAEGAQFYERSVRMLADIDEAERAAASGEPASAGASASTPVSRSAPTCWCRWCPSSSARHPQITLDIVHTDLVVDLLADRTDVAVRAGPMRSSSLVARGLGESALRLVAAPAYLARRGTPATPADLEHHDRLCFGYARASEGWPLVVDGTRVTIPPAGPIQASDGEALRHLAVAGAGIARLADFTIRADIAAGRLVPVLEPLDPAEREAFHAVYVGRGGPLPARVRALLDFLAEHGRIG